MSHLGPSLRRASRPRSAGRRVVAALLFSLLANVLFLSRLDLTWLSRVDAVRPRAVALASLTARDWEANRAVGALPQALPPRAPAPPPVPPPPPEPEKNPLGQVVTIAPPANQTPPKESRFLAEYSSSVEKETVARQRGNYRNVAPAPAASLPQSRPEVSEGRTSPDQKEKASAPGRGETQGAGERKLPRQEAQEKLALLGKGGNLPPRQERQGVAGDGDRLDLSGGSSSTPGPQGRPGAPDPTARIDLRPSAKALGPIAGAPAPDDVRGVEEGEATFLNTREWKYAGFFSRIGAEIYDPWISEARKEISARDPSLRAFMYKDRETVLGIRLDRNGYLVDLRVLHGSGADFLDQAAVKAFRRAQPFVNPPSGMLDQRGEIAFTWGFTLYGASGSGAQLFLGPGYR